MSFITLKCKNCGSQMTLNTESHSATCTHCGSTFLLADVLDEQDIRITESTTGKDIERKMLAGDDTSYADPLIVIFMIYSSEIIFKNNKNPEHEKSVFGVHNT